MFSGISIWQLLIVLAIIVLIFGTKKLKNMGGDLGGAVKGFKDAMREGESEQEQKRVANERDKADQRRDSEHADAPREKDKL